MTKKNALQIKLSYYAGKLEALRAKYPNGRSRTPIHEKERKEYARQSKPLCLKINALRYYIRLEEKKTDKLLNIARIVAELTDIETLWQKGRARAPQLVRARHLFVVIARQSGLGTWLVQWYLNKEAKTVCGIPSAYKMGWRRIRKNKDYREAFTRITFALNNGKK